MRYSRISPKPVEPIRLATATIHIAKPRTAIIPTTFVTATIIPIRTIERRLPSYGMTKQAYEWNCKSFSRLADDWLW